MIGTNSVTLGTPFRRRGTGRTALKTVLKNELPKERRILKLSALLRLRMALIEEHYEFCEEYISEARHLGARPNEISRILFNPVSREFEGE